MKNRLLTFPILLAALCCGCASGPPHPEGRKSFSADNTAEVTGLLKHKPVEFSPDVCDKLVDSSLRLLATCGYFGKRTWPDFEKSPHLHFTFATPRRVKIQELEAPLQVQEMVVTLPLTSGVFWVRSGDAGLYLSKFDCAVCSELQSILKEAQR